MKDQIVPDTLVSIKLRLHRMADFVYRLFSLQSDTAEEETVDSIVRNVEFRSGNAWTLVFAIFIASIGLNTNSTAVVIGAMLISPLMGPILGAGLALGTYDSELFKKSLRSFGIAVAISILASFFYFALIPLGEAQSELLARTKPTAFDVLIAIFGGATGIVAISRKDKTNAVPGVAIATALMPPLCTAGYGLASGQFQYFFGALYLFLINSIYICLTTYLFVRLLKFKSARHLDLKRKNKIQKLMASIALLTFLPSLGLAWYYTKEVSFYSNASKFLKREFRFPGVTVVNHEFSFALKNRSIVVSLIGKQLAPAEIEVLKERQLRYDLAGVTLELNQSTLEEDLERRLNEKLESELSIKSKSNGTTFGEMELLRAQVQEYRSQGALSVQILEELSITMPEVKDLKLTFLSLGKADQSSVSEDSVQDSTSDLAHVALAKWKGRSTKQGKKKLESFLRTRLRDPGLVVYEVL